MLNSLFLKGRFGLSRILTEVCHTCTSKLIFSGELKLSEQIWGIGTCYRTERCFNFTRTVLNRSGTGNWLTESTQNWFAKYLSCLMIDRLVTSNSMKTANFNQFRELCVTCYRSTSLGLRSDMPGLNSAGVVYTAKKSPGLSEVAEKCTCIQPCPPSGWCLCALRHGICNGNPVGVRGQRGDRKIQGRQKMCRDRGSNSGLRN